MKKPKIRTQFHKIAITVYGIGTLAGCLGVGAVAYKTDHYGLFFLMPLAFVLWLSELFNYLNRVPK